MMARVTKVSKNTKIFTIMQIFSIIVNIKKGGEDNE